MKFYLLWVSHILVKTTFLVLVFSMLQIPILVPNYCVTYAADKRMESGVLSHLGKATFVAQFYSVSLSCKVISSEIVNETEM